ncbi:disulfide bond formation protein DsbB [Robbsia andropogonis]|uniref:disulfide bond formation protein B n=1 Tax=Robbsia andropogonis TaxID=28092 RepID=UPI003D1C3C9A
MKQFLQSGLGPYVDEIALSAVSLTLAAAFYFQLVRDELPCPLCLLQRAGFLLVGAGFLFNIRFGSSRRHIGMALIGCVVTGLVAIRQVFLHILPNATGYGDRLFGLHLYTWTLIAAVCATLCIALMLMQPKCRTVAKTCKARSIRKFVVGLFAVVVVANLMSTLLECGVHQCADNPIAYQWPLTL